jgi:hypothetical protein
VVDLEARAATVRCDHHIKLEGRDEDFVLEFVWLLSSTDDGTRIKHIIEFIDTAECMKYVPIMAEVAKAKGIPFNM